MRTTLPVVIVVLASATAVAAPQRARTHTVISGDSLWTIARSYGCDVDRVTQANRLDSTLLQPGQKLRIPRCESGSPAETKSDRAGKGPTRSHLVVEGDTLGHIAKLYGSSVEDIQARNGLSGTTIYPGQELRVLPGTGATLRAIAGQSVGRTNHGKLVGGTQLPPGGDVYFRRRPERAWGANQTVFHIRRAANAIRRKFPKLHKLAIGDLSAKKGGKITMHSSHQSGRDVDLGFYYRKRPKRYPKEFVTATRDNLDWRATLQLIETLAATHDQPAGVEMMFLSYPTQRLIYEQALKNKVPRRELDPLFQYPHGPESHRALIRHEPGHEDHIHVRFKCPENDDSCK